MEIRILAGWKGLRRAAAVGGVCLLAVTGLLAQASGATGGLGKPDDPGASEPKPSIERPMMYPRANYVWPFATGPNYGEVASRDWNKAGVLHTRVGSFDLTRGMPALPATLRTSNQLGQTGVQYFVLQVDPASFSDGRFDRVKEMLNAQGGAIVQEMPVAAFIVRLTSSGYAGIQAASGVTALEPYHPAFKLSPAIGRAPLPNAEKALSDVYTLEAMLFKGEDATSVAQALGKLGANVVSVQPDMIRFDVNRSKLGEAAGIQAIESIHEFLPVYPHGEEASASIQTARPKGGAGGVDLAYTAAGIDGSGNGIAGTSAQILMVLDSGIQVDAGDLADTRALAGTVGAAHRKVKLYTPTNAFAGGGDLLGCDSQVSGSFTHGHIVSAAALGAANRVPVGYGAPWVKIDTNGNPWKFDGVAPGAVLMAYDANVTPTLLGCSDPSNSGLNVGTVYTPTVLNSGSLGDAYSRGARISNFSWGSTNDETYSTNSSRVDSFLFENKDAMVFLSAGNDSEDIAPADQVPDNGTISAPATSKSAAVIGASNTFAASGLSGNARAGFSSVGPATVTSNRVAPLLMAPGTDTGTNGFGAEYACRTGDNDSAGSTECDTSEGAGGTSFASPNAAGAGLLVRDYFAQGFYPDGTTANSGNLADRVPNISGALVKSVLIASADWMNFFDPQANKQTNQATPPMNMQYRFNMQQGYGRIQLNNVLPLSTYADTPTGLLVCDGGIGGGVCNIAGLSGTAGPSTTETYTFDVADNTQELRIALSWIEAASESLAKDLDLELVNPGGTITYWGNYFTDDDNKNFVIDAGEDCDYSNSVPWPGDTVTNEPDFSPWSLPTCANSNRDTQNPTEAIMLSPDAALNGLVDNLDTTNIDEGSDNQIQTGTWTLRVIGRTVSGTQPYAIAMTGPVSLGSSLRIQRVRPDNELGTGAFICNDRARIDVNEVGEAGDLAGGLTAVEISSRTTVQAIDPIDGIFGNDAASCTAAGVPHACCTGIGVGTCNAASCTAAGVPKACCTGIGVGTCNDGIDTELNLPFTDVDGGGAGLKFSSNLLLLTDGTAPESGNGALDVKSGGRIIVTYADELGGSPDPNKVRVNSALIDCSTQILAGGLVWGQFGKDAFSLVSGGCEKDQRGFFTFGFPDKYMDEGELIDYRLAFQSTETADLEDVRVTLKPVLVDGDSPATCLPGSSDCADPNRANNATFGLITVLDSPKILGRVRAGNGVSANFSLQIGTGIPANTTIEMLLGVSARKSGKPVESFAVSRHPLNRDEVSLFYSTDFPSGGTQQRDTNNNELIETATTNEKDFFGGDYRLETVNWSSLTATGRNGSIQAPWNFDSNDNGFRSGLHNDTNTSVVATIALWGEDRNFNNVLDAGEDRDPVGDGLTQGWSTLGGCGWQTNSGANRGVWHTGRINDTASANCTFSANGAGRCQTYETYPGTTGASAWWELLLTPVFEKVNLCTTGAELNCLGRIDAPKEPVFTVEFLNMAWNASMDIGDDLTALTWTLDTDTSSINPIDLLNGGVLNALFGQMGSRAGGNSPLTDGFPMFAQISSCQDAPGSVNGSIKTCGGLEGGATCTDDTPCSGNTLNGSLGGNRTASNNCFFEGKTGGVANAQLPYGLSKPADDDSLNGYCRRTDELDDVDRTKLCRTNAECVATVDYPNGNGQCTVVGAVVDDFVTTNGPIRNMDISQVNGPDMRLSTLEDIYGDSGESFQGSLGFFISEGIATNTPVSSFGVALDDVVVEWREFRLDPDATPCTASSAQCATINISQTNAFDGNALVHVTVLDSTPYAPGVVKNDCNGDGDFADGTDDTDCNNNGILDVTVRLISAREPAGEIAVLDRIGTTFGYAVDYPVSSSYDTTPGVLFISRDGTANPQVRAQYTDRDDGTGVPCKTAAAVEQRGLLETSTTIFLAAGRIAIRSVRLVDNGDNDGFADTNETVQMFVSVTNKSGQDLSDLTATLQSNDPKIECISGTTVSFTAPGSPLNDKATGESLTPFVFRVRGTADCSPTVGPACGQRQLLNERFFAAFRMNVRSERFDVGARALPIDVELDLNYTGNPTVIGYSEGFESNGRSNFLTFTSTGATLDTNKATVALSDGYRCQYNDPTGPNPNGPNRTTCFMGFANAAQNAYDWHIHNGTALDNNVGRAYVGTRSLHWGVHPAAGAKRDTTRFSQLEGLRSLNPLSLPVVTSSELSFKHQVSFTDNRITNTSNGETADRGVVSLQLADSLGAGFGDWIKIFPYENDYDAQGTDGFTNCTFDPIDDGSDEDDFDDPLDPFRRLGPSTTCFPEFVFAWGGNTDHQKSPGDMSLLGRAEGPGLRGAIDRGTWVQPKFLLDPFKGRRIRLRFIATTIEVNPAVTVNDTNIGADDESGDDGWYIDEISIPQVLQSPVTLSIDNNANAGLAACANCTAINAVIAVDPANSAAPGQPVVIDASGSSANACPNGTLQYKFWNDANDNNTIDAPADVVLRDWTDNPVFFDAPLGQTAPSTAVHYAVQVRCSTRFEAPNNCGTPAAFSDVTVTCPTTNSLTPLGPFSATVTFTNKTTLSFTSQIYDAIRGDLIALRSSGKFNGAVRLCLGDSQTAGTIIDAENPTTGNGSFYLLRRGNHECNQLGTWSTGNVRERAGRDLEIGQDPRTCP